MLPRDINIRVSICNDTIETDFMQIGSLQLQHLVDPRAIDHIGSLSYLDGSTIRSSKTRRDELFAVLVEEVEGG